MKPILVLSILGAVLAHAQTPSVLTLEECIRKALAVPSAVSIARIDRQIADRDRSIARAGFLPQLNGTLGYNYTSPSKLDPGEFSFVAQNAIHEYIGLGHIMQEIDTSGRIRAEVARALANQRAAQASTAIAERDLKRAVSAAYYRLLLSRRLAVADHGQRAIELVAAHHALPEQLAVLGTFGLGLESDVVS